MFGEQWKDPAAETEASQGKDASAAPTAAGGKGVHATAQPPPPAVDIAIFCKWFVAVLAFSGVVIGFAVVAATSGTQSPQGIPRAALVILEGFKGTTFDALMARNKLPNIQYLAAQGTRAACVSIDDARCARTQSGPLLGPEYTWTSGPGIASILTGVDAAKHQVRNDTFDEYSHFSSTSAQFPSVLAQAKAGGRTTQVIGASHLITSRPSSAVGAACSLLGVADFECGTDAVARCLQPSTCNVNVRATTLPVNDFQGTEEAALGSMLAASFATLPSDLLVVHANKLARLAQDPSYPLFTFDVDSDEYAAEAYVLDSVVGQLTTFITDRVVRMQENWLVVLTSDHGGLGKSFGTNTDDDEVIPLVIATLTANGNLALRQLSTPTTQMDVAPTILSWLGLTVPSWMDGVVQGLCSTGIVPTDCPIVM